MTTSPTTAFFFVHVLRRFADDFKAVPNYLADNGMDTFVYTQSPPSGERDGPSLSGSERLDRDRSSFADSVEHRELPLGRASMSVRDIAATMRTGWRLGRENPDALFVMWTIVPIILIGLPLRVQGRRCVFMKTGMGSVFAGDSIKDRIVRFVVSLVYRVLFRGKNSRVITHNFDDLDFIADSFGVERGHLMATPGCGVVPDEFPRQPEPNNDPPIVLVPVRLLAEKGIFDAVEASRLLAERGVQHRMWLSSDVDPGNPSSLTSEQLDEIHLTIPTVEVLGFQDQVQPLYAQCDFVLVPTKYREGLPTALIESAASGRPLVTTDNYGGNEIITNNVTGIMVDKGDAVAMADGLQRFIEDRPFAAEIREQAYEQFLNAYTKSHMLQRTVELFRTLQVELPDVPLAVDEPRRPERLRGDRA